MKHLGVLVAASVVLSAQQAWASPCGEQIAALERTIQAEKTKDQQVLPGPESLGAKLHHQPTPASVDQAKQNAHSDVLELLAKAKDLNAKGESAQCRQIVADLRSLVK